MGNYYVRDPKRIFDLDKSGFSTRGMALGKGKCIVKVGTRGITRELKFRVSCNHVTLMSVVSGASQIMMLFVVLPGVEAMYRR